MPASAPTPALQPSARIASLLSAQCQSPRDPQPPQLAFRLRFGELQAELGRLVPAFGLFEFVERSLHLLRLLSDDSLPIGLRQFPLLGRDVGPTVRITNRRYFLPVPDALMLRAVSKSLMGPWKSFNLNVFGLKLYGVR